MFFVLYSSYRFFLLNTLSCMYFSPKETSRSVYILVSAIFLNKLGDGKSLVAVDGVPIIADTRVCVALFQ